MTTSRTVAVVQFPGLERRPGCAVGAEGARRRLATRLARRDRAAARDRRRRAARRLLVRRLPALRRDRALRADHGRRHALRRRRRARARDVQRLPDPLRGRPAPGRAAPERVAVLHLPRRRRARRAERHRVHVTLRARPAADDPDQARRGRLVRTAELVEELDARGQLLLRYEETPTARSRTSQA